MNDESYSTVAEEQLDALELADPATYRDVMLICGLVFDHTDRAHALSSAITTSHGIVMRLAVPGRGSLKVFWTREGGGDGPRIEAVLEHP